MYFLFNKIEYNSYSLPNSVFLLKNSLNNLTDLAFFLSFVNLFYGYFLLASGGLAEADFTSLEGVIQLFKNATPASVAAGWIHYLAFDFWVGCTLLLWSQKQGIPHFVVVFPLICTFMLGPLGVLLFVIFTRAYRALKPKA